MKIAISLIASVFGVPSEQINQRRPSTKEDTRDLWFAGSPSSESKWSNLRRVVNHFNPQIDHQRQIESYGCSCLNIFSYEGVSGGAAVDAIDRSCKHLKECYKCAKQWHGDDCDPANKKYEMFSRPGLSILAVNNEVGGDGEAAGCERALFECDQQYAKELINSLPSWDADKTIFSGLWDPQGNPEQCSGQSFSTEMPDRMMLGFDDNSQADSSFSSGQPVAMEADPTGVMTRPLMVGLWGNTRELMDNKQCCQSDEGLLTPFNSQKKQCCYGKPMPLRSC
ncbi:Oidioi.mRNA.OKI2018_I69.PAR.g9920.t1.cds [Oikopleura dioica]|uniref:Oidioi.mRNA.OKI2018_I69.PAR.g9920.t1.cds n=1 Tax=Oikopleura dioica TaxID=34765 RepID=A0ABN7RMX9_OIKDI|nr:Oidioi.mRNA.OKI2018_I69.PAR.g9920.t1.cds [Oikopleura dioica]